MANCQRGQGHCRRNSQQPVNTTQTSTESTPIRLEDIISTDTGPETPAVPTEDMPMNHYINAIPIRQEEPLCCQMKELNRILDCQNRILSEILAVLERPHHPQEP